MASNIQFLRSTVKSLRPYPHTLSLGTPMVNVNDEDPGLFFRSKDGNLLKIGPVHVGSYPPNAVSPGGGNPALCIGEQWLSTVDLNYPKLLTWNGGNWIESVHAALIYVQEVDPRNPSLVEGALWFKPSTRELFLYREGIWIDIQRKPYGDTTEIQYNKNDEFHSDSKFTYNDTLNQLNVGSILFPNGNISDGSIPGEDNWILLKRNDNFASSADFQFNPVEKKLTVLGNCVLGNEVAGPPNTLNLYGSIFCNGSMAIGRNAGDLLIINSTTMVQNDITFGSDFNGNVRVQCPATFTNNVDIGGDPDDILSINSIITTSNDMALGVDDSKDIVVTSNVTVMSGCTLDTGAVLNQWYLEKLTNTVITTPQVGQILVHGPGNKWYNEHPGAGPYGNVVEEAPMDGQKYVRQNGAWVVA